MNETEDTRQLQLWNPIDKIYYVIPNVNLDDARRIAGGRAWRIAKASRALKPKYTGPHRSASDRSVDTVREQYFKWAESVRLPCVTDYANKISGYFQPAKATWVPYPGVVKRVDPDAYFAVETSEIDELLS
jgi:hypothetical protein